MRSEVVSYDPGEKRILAMVECGGRKVQVALQPVYAQGAITPHAYMAWLRPTPIGYASIEEAMANAQAWIEQWCAS